MLPKWDADLNISVLSQRYTMEQLIERDSMLHVSAGAGNIVVVEKDVPLAPVTLGDCLKIDDFSVRTAQTLGDLKFDMPDIVNTGIPLGTMFPMLWDGTYAVGPQTSARTAVAVEAQRYFSQVTFAHGDAIFQLTNALSLPLTFPNGVDVVDGQGRTIAHAAIPGTLPAGASTTLPPIALAGLTLYDAMSLSLTIATPGSGGTPVPVARTSALRVRGSLVNTGILSAVAYLPAQTCAHTETVPLFTGAGTRMESGVVKSGTLELSLRSFANAPSTVDFAMGDATAADGTPLHRNVALAANGTTDVSIDLAGVTVRPADAQSLAYVVTLATAAAGGAPIRLAAHDSLVAGVRLSHVMMDRITGTVEPRTLTLHQTAAMPFPLPAGLHDGYTLTEAHMRADFHNGSGLPVDIDGGVVHDAAGGASVSIPSATLAPNATTSVACADGAVLPFVDAMLARASGSVTVDGQLTLNKRRASGTVSAADAIDGTLHVEIPLRVAIDQAAMTDTTPVTLGADTRDGLMSANGGTLTFEFENHLPAGVTIAADMLDDAHRTLFSPTGPSGSPLRVAAASVDAEGRATSAAHAKTDVAISGDDFRMLARSSFVRLRLLVDGPDPRPVVFRTTDYIVVRAYARINVSSDIVVK